MSMRVAIYRVLYGEDFIAESIASILPVVDQVIVAKAERPWGKSTGVTYKGEWVPWPEKFDDTRDRVASLGAKNVQVVDDFFPVTANQLQHLVNDIILPRFPKTDEFVFIEPDHVFTAEALLKTIREWNEHPDWRQATTRMIELWKTPLWRVPERHRASVIFHRINGPIGETTGDGAEMGVPSTWFTSEVHNMGFCMSEKIMRWKHLTAMAFSQEIQDSPPDPEWLDRWINWKPGDVNLEISLGAQAQIPKVIPYDPRQTPLSIQKKFWGSRAEMMQELEGRQA